MALVEQSRSNKILEAIWVLAPGDFGSGGSLIAEEQMRRSETTATSLHGYAFGEVARFIDIAAERDRSSEFFFSDTASFAPAFWRRHLPREIQFRTNGD